MARLSSETIEAISAEAKRQGLPAAAVLAVVEVESGGRAFYLREGKVEPVIRFEGHYFDRLLAPALRTKARALGLASPQAGKIANPRKQADRWAMLERACRIDRDAALQSVSWGVGQVMGAHYKSLGYRSVAELADEARSGVAGQVRLMLRFIETNNLRDALIGCRWAEFARVYNGPAYAKNRYDEKLAAAFSAYRARTQETDGPSAALRRGMRGGAVRDLQVMLTHAGYWCSADGVFGPGTENAVRRFQAAAKLSVDGIAGAQTMAALETGGGRTPAWWAWLMALVLRIFRRE